MDVPPHTSASSHSGDSGVPQVSEGLHVLQGGHDSGPPLGEGAPRFALKVPHVGHLGGKLFSIFRTDTAAASTSMARKSAPSRML